MSRPARPQSRTRPPRLLAAPAPLAAAADPAARERLEGLLRQCCALAASDLHLTAGERPSVRRVGALEPLEHEPPLTAEALAAMAASVLDPGQREAFAGEGSLDLALSLPEGARFRVNLFRERDRVALSIRRLDERIRSFDELRLPAGVAELAELDQGLVLLVGPTGSGKSTTLAALIDRISATRPVHVVTLEDPIEYLHTSKRALIRQRQLHTDFVSFARALRATLREDPDVILVGEMRDRATLRATLTAAETGHLVFSTLHAGSAAGAAERFAGAFAEGERDSVRHQLSHVLRAVVAQRLLRTRDGAGRVPAVELLRVTPAVANLIRTGRTAQIASALESGASLGMQTLEQSLAALVGQGRVAEGEARRVARDENAFAERLRAPGGTPRRAW